MKFRLKILLAILVVLSGVLAARAEFLTRKARFHQHEAARYTEMIRQRRNITQVEVDIALEVARKHPDDARLSFRFKRVLHHRAVAANYGACVYRPWLVVHEPPVPERTYDD